MKIQIVDDGNIHWIEINGKRIGEINCLGDSGGSNEAYVNINILPRFYGSDYNLNEVKVTLDDTVNIRMYRRR